MRELSEEFAALVPEYRVMMERVDVQEVYYQVEYSIHLGRVGTKRIAGILLCDTRCPLLGRYCTCEYLKVRGFSDHTQHVAAGTATHQFPTGVNARDRPHATYSE